MLRTSKKKFEDTINAMNSQGAAGPKLVKAKKTTAAEFLASLEYESDNDCDGGNNCDGGDNGDGGDDSDDSHSNGEKDLGVTA